MSPLTSLTQLRSLSLNRLVPKSITSVIAAMTQLTSLEIGNLALQPRSVWIWVDG